MINISGFLEKFKKFDNDKTLQTENILKIIGKVLGITLTKKDITVKDRVLTILGSPALKQEIFLNKKQLGELLSKEGIIDVR